MLALTGAKMVSDADKAERDRKLAAKTQLYSPWTNLQAGPVKDADPAGTAAQGLGAYMGYEQATEDADLQKKWVDASIRSMDRGGSGGAPGAATVNIGGDSVAYLPRGYQRDTQADYWGDVMNADRNAYVDEAVNNGRGNPWIYRKRR
jgi:hypothetical protein